MVLALQNIILEMIASGDSLEDTMDRLCLEVERRAPGVVCSVLSVDAMGLLQHLSGPSLPARYSALLHGLPIGPEVGACGSAAYHRSDVSVVDIETDPRCADFKHLAVSEGLLAVWSRPIFIDDGPVLGTFALYYREKRGPTELEIEMLDACVRLCAIALERHARVTRRQYLAFTDALTGLGNRASFDAALGARPMWPDGHFGLLLIDVDNLKIVNDTFGHEAGDDLIRHVADRLAASVEPDRAYRLGGDEFAVIVDTSHSESAIGNLASNILTELKRPARCGRYMLMPSATIGVAAQSTQNLTAQRVRESADLALYHAKETQRGHFVCYQEGMDTAITERARTIAEISAAVSDNRIVVWYQPVFHLETGTIVGVEALCRLRTQSGDVIPAAHFLDATADVQVATRLTERVLARVGADVREWEELGTELSYVGINVSSADLLGGHIDVQLRRAFERRNIRLTKIMLELAERTYASQRDDAVSTEMRRLRAKGLRFALDDYGGGPASLMQLLSAPIDAIKIGRAFVNDLSSGSSNEAVLTGLAQITGKLGVGVLASYIETSAQCTQLRSLGCQFGQGFRLAPPMPAEEIGVTLRRQLFGGGVSPTRDLANEASLAELDKGTTIAPRQFDQDELGRQMG